MDAVKRARAEAAAFRKTLESLEAMGQEDMEVAIKPINPKWRLEEQERLFQVSARVFIPVKKMVKVYEEYPRKTVRELLEEMRKHEHGPDMQ